MLTTLLETINEHSRAIIVIRDTPRMGIDPLLCPSVRNGCSTDRLLAMRGEDLLFEIAKGTGLATAVDFTDAICDAEKCDAVVGNMLVWRDRHHLTATYSRSLAPVVAEAILGTATAARSTVRLDGQGRQFNGIGRSETN